MNSRVADWLIGHDTGLSSLAIVAWMEGDPQAFVREGRFHHYQWPRDPADLGRCLRLLELDLIYRARLPEMAAASPQWARLIAKWDKLEALYRKEEPSGKAPKTYRLMYKLIYQEPFPKHKHKPPKQE